MPTTLDNQIDSKVSSIEIEHCLDVFGGRWNAHEFMCVCCACVCNQLTVIVSFIKSDERKRL